MVTECRICRREVDGGDLVVWDGESDTLRVETYLGDLRTTPKAVMHGECFIAEYGAASFVHLAQEHMIDLAGGLNNAVLHISAQNDKLREHRLRPLEFPSE